jgi:ABC-type amino acid transport substrate-binding protein
MGDLPGQVVGIQTGTIAETWARENQEALGISSFVTYETLADALMDLKVGRTTAVINNGPYMQYQASMDPEISVIAIIDEDPIICAIAFNQADTRLCAEVNQALAELIAEGVYASLYEKWFGGEPSDQFKPAG